jgi:hypothetical protein
VLILESELIDYLQWQQWQQQLATQQEDPEDTWSPYRVWSYYRRHLLIRIEVIKV